MIKNNWKDFKDDLAKPIPKVKRAWLRIPVTLILSPLMLFLAVCSGVYEGTMTFVKEFLICCILGE